MYSKNKILSYLIGFIAIFIATSAAYFSIFGISKLFHGAFIEVIIMASGLEAGKLICVSYIYQYWKSIRNIFKIINIFLIAGLMLITSMGIYGFLSSAYQDTYSKFNIKTEQVNNLEFQKDIFIKKINFTNDKIKTDKEQLDYILVLRSQQERRLDSLYVKQYWKSIRITETSILNFNIEIQRINNEINTSVKQLGSFNDSIVDRNLKILNINAIDTSTELGPLIYISKLFDTPMDKVVNYLILILIFIFDPLAISLIIAFNHTISIRGKEDIDDKPRETSISDVEEIEDEYRKKIKDNIHDTKDKYNDIIKEIEVIEDIKEAPIEIKKEIKEVDKVIDVFEKTNDIKINNVINESPKKGKDDFGGIIP